MIATRHRNDPAPSFPALAGFTVRRETSAEVMAGLQNRSEIDMGRRMWDEHRAYVASIDGEDVGFGWVATDMAMIGEIEPGQTRRFVVDGVNGKAPAIGSRVSLQSRCASEIVDNHFDVIAPER